MKLWSISVMSLALAVCVSAAVVAQEEGRGRGEGRAEGRGRVQEEGRGRGGPGQGGGRGFGGMGMPGSALELIGLLRAEEVQKEVGLEPETFQSIQSSMPDMRALFQASPEERAAKLKEANAKAQDVIDEALSPTQQKRLLGLLVQQQGLRAVTNDLVAKEIGLDSAKIEELQELMAKTREEMGEKMRATFADSGEGDRQEKMREAMEQMRKEVDQAIADKLSDEQKERLETLKGDAFTFSERPAFGRGGPGGRGPDADRQGGDRPESGNRRNRGGTPNN